MNKLVSKNPVLRFKEGKKIAKAGFGTTLEAIGYALGLHNPESKNGVLKTPQITGDYLYTTGGRWGRLASLDEINKSWGSSTSNKLSQSSQIENSQNKSLQAYKARRLLEINATKKATSVGRQSSTPRRPLKTREQWDTDFNTAKNQLSAQQLMYLDSLGIDTSSAEKMQQGINAYNKNSRLVVDNKWGDKSRAALNNILSSMPTNYRNEDTLLGLDNEKNIPEVFQNPIKVTPQSTPNFGYRTNNTYEDNDFSNRLKSMGIRSNADLIDFGWRTLGNNYDWKGNDWAKQFRSDINLALGGDWSDANIRKTFNTSGNWGRGFLGSGDISDFQKALLTNAGTWNGAYDRAKELYEANNPKTSYIPMKKNYKEIFEKIFNALNSNKEEDKSYINRINEQISKNLFKQPFYNIAPIKMPEYNPYPNNPSAIKMPELTLPNNSILPIHMPSYNPYTRSFSFKLGGQLVSRNPILRFKSNFRYVAQ